MAKRPQPTRLGAVIIPEIFTDRGLVARGDEWADGLVGLERSREMKDARGRKIYPARMFPPPGRPLSFLGARRNLLDDRGRELSIEGVGPVHLLPEIEYVIRVIETIKPVRIVSVHGKKPRTRDHLKAAQTITGMTDDQIAQWDGVSAIKGINFPGIFVDPRYQPRADCQDQFDVERCKFARALDPVWPRVGNAADKRFDSALTQQGRADDAVALAAAKAVHAIDNTLVRGNHVPDPPEVVHYAKETGTADAYSLGDWGPVEVPANVGVGARPGAPVFTIETKDNNESWAFIDGVQVMDEDGKPLTPVAPPDKRAVHAKVKPYSKPDKFRQERSRQLQAYAQGIIDTILRL